MSRLQHYSNNFQLTSYKFNSGHISYIRHVGPDSRSFG